MWMKDRVSECPRVQELFKDMLYLQDDVFAHTYDLEDVSSILRADLL